MRRRDLIKGVSGRLATDGALDYGTCFDRSLCAAMMRRFECLPHEGCSIMLRITIYATLIVILTIGAASAQTDKTGIAGKYQFFAR